MKIKSLVLFKVRLAQLSPVLSECENLTKTTALFLLGAQAMLCVGAAVTRAMLHGDGSYFVFAIAAGDPWGIKWKALETRLSTYVLTVVPTTFFSNMFELSGDQIAVVNGLIFYGVQWLQYLIVVLLAWRQFPQLLIFPIVQYGLSLGLGFGYPSEMLLAPGFFWICLFSLARSSVPWPLVIAAFLGLVFSHEAAEPTALLVVAFAWIRHLQHLRVEPISLIRFASFAAFAVVVLVIWLVIRLHGGGAGGDTNAIYVLDPRRILNNPTMWLILLAVIIFSVAPLAKVTPSPRNFLVIALTCVFITVFASIVLNFADGRYDSARTLIAASSVILGVIFVMQQSGGISPNTGPLPPNVVIILKNCVVAVLSINLAASAIFLWEWNQARQAFAAVVNSPTEKVRVVSYEEVRGLFGIDGARFNDRMGFHWTWPYRSIVLAPNFQPDSVIVDVEDMFSLCENLTLANLKASRIPTEITDSLSRYACAQPKPPDKRYFRQWLITHWNSLWNK